MIVALGMMLRGRLGKDLAELSEPPVGSFIQDGAGSIGEDQSSWRRADDPGADGWNTESFALEAERQLSILGDLLRNQKGPEPDLHHIEALGLVGGEFTCQSFVPPSLTSVYSDGLISVEGAIGPEEGQRFLPGRGPAALAAAVHDVVILFGKTAGLRFEFKIFEVIAEAGEREVQTRQYVSLVGKREGRLVEQHATWLIGWEWQEASAPVMRSLVVERFEQSTSHADTGVLFADCTESVLGGNENYASQFLRGMNHWFTRLQLQDTRYFALLGTPGLAVGDVNGDGLDDLYVCQESGLPNRLFLQQSDGSAQEVSARWGIDWIEDSRGVLLADFDNDGDQDLAVAILGGVIVAENNGKDRFQMREVLATGHDTMSLCAADFDHDGRIDLYVCVYAATQGLEKTQSSPIPGAAPGFVTHDANDGGSNSLWRNESSGGASWKFRDVTRESGLDVLNSRYSFAAVWEDFDNDGDSDLYVANDFGRDNFYRNEGRSAAGGVVRFTEASGAVGAEDAGSGMSVTCADYDRDGWTDVLVSNMWSAAGRRVTLQERFKPGISSDLRLRYRRLARGNTLLGNRGDGTFSDRSAGAGIEPGLWAWGSLFFDLNNDGWEDLLVTNGFITTEDTGDL
ncbi:MAG: VCBS repeat-containing protein [Roseibacillus sp.]|nr:VCBS repeat-containing protein [Roseibacillus sp.]